MGQGQAELALQLLDECTKTGHWLCLKNLHLVTSFLPQIEKVMLDIQCTVAASFSANNKIYNKNDSSVRLSI